jgi:phosphoribosyl 1,2-cyclic phosphate 1,2-diphosphodiesterase
MIDLHCHTNVSDGSSAVTEVLELAQASGVSQLALTDHDTTVGIADAVGLGHEYGIEVIPGIEISAFDFQHDCRAHILGYFIDPMNQELLDLCAPLVARRHNTSRQMVARLIEQGYNISWEQVCRYAGRTGVYKQHIMHALLDAGYCVNLFGQLYKTLFSRGASGKAPGLAYLPMQYVDAVLAIKAIRKAGGVPVLAHPGEFDNFPAVPLWVEAGLAGIEVYHPSHSPLEEDKAMALAGQFDLIMTAGSDYHGFYGTGAQAPGTRMSGVATIDALKERKEYINLR